MKVKNYSLLFFVLICLEVSLQVFNTILPISVVEIHLEEDHKSNQKEDIKKYQQSLKFIKSNQVAYLVGKKFPVDQPGPIAILLSEFTKEVLTPPPE